MRLFVLLAAFLLLLVPVYALSCPPGVSDWHLCPDYELNVEGNYPEFSLSVPSDLAGVVSAIYVYPECSVEYKEYIPSDRVVYLGRVFLDVNERYDLYSWFHDVRLSGDYYLNPLLGVCIYRGYADYGPCYGFGYRFERMYVLRSSVPECRVRVLLCTYAGCFESVGEGTDVVDVNFPELRLAFSFRLRSGDLEYLSVPRHIAVVPHTGEAYDAGIPDFRLDAGALPSIASDISRFAGTFLPVHWLNPHQYDVRRSYRLSSHISLLSPSDVNKLRDFIYEWLSDPFEESVVDLNEYRLHGFVCSPVSFRWGDPDHPVAFCEFPVSVHDANMYFFDSRYMEYFKIGVFDPDDVFVSVDVNSRRVDVSSPVELTVFVHNRSDANLPVSVRLNLDADYYSADALGFYLHPGEANEAHVLIYALPAKRFPLEVNVYAGVVLLESEVFELSFPHDFNRQESNFYCINNVLYAYLPGRGFRKVKECLWGCSEDRTSCEPPFWVKHQRLITFLGAGIGGLYAGDALVADLAKHITSPWKLFALGVVAFGAALLAWYLAQDLYHNHPDCLLARWAPFLAMFLPFLVGGVGSLIAIGILWLLCVFVRGG